MNMLGGGGGMMSSMLVSFPALMIAQKIDWENPNNVLYARLAFVIVQIVCYFTGKYIKGKVDERKDERVIYVPPPSVGSLFGGGGNTANKQYRKTTYYVMEAEKASQMSSQTFVNAMLMGFLSYKMEVHLPLVMQVVLSPVQLLSSELFSKYVRGVEKPGALGEVLELPEGATVAEDGAPAAGNNADNNTPADNTNNTQPSNNRGKRDVVESTPASRANDLLRNLIDATWTKNAVLDITAVEGCVRSGADINVQLAPDGWTPLMIACGVPSNSGDVIKRLLAMGADRYQKDNDGWCALHWAAQNNNLTAATLLLQDLSDAEKLELLGSQSKTGEIPLEVATECKKAPEVAVYLSDVTKVLVSGTVGSEDEVKDDNAINTGDVAVDSDDDDHTPDNNNTTGIRQRKVNISNTTAIPDID